MKRLAIVVQRYGLEVNGGAELLARQLAEHLLDEYEVEVLTTKAVSYLTWKDEYTKDIEEVNKVTVRRFSVKHGCNRRIFNWYYPRVIGKKHTLKQEKRWFKLQGPKSDALIDYIKDNEKEYDVFVFMTYLYYPTVMGMPLVKDKAVFIPTAHDEETIYMDTFKELFNMPKGIFYLTKQEKEFVEKTFHNEHILNNDGHGGCGIEVPQNVDAKLLLKNKNVDEYIIYAGRIDEAKGCPQLFEFFLRYRKETGSNVKLVLIGKEAMKVPEDEGILNMGFVSEEEKYSYMAGAKLLVMPSQFESLSIVVLEAMALKRPVLCNGLCEVLKGHCESSEAGLYYTNYEEFKNSLDKLLTDKDMNHRMGINGRKYIDDNYTWNIIVKRFCELVERVVL